MGGLGLWGPAASCTPGSTWPATVGEMVPPTQGPGLPGLMPGLDLGRTWARKPQLSLGVRTLRLKAGHCLGKSSSSRVRPSHPPLLRSAKVSRAAPRATPSAPPSRAGAGEQDGCEGASRAKGPGRPPRQPGGRASEPTWPSSPRCQAPERPDCQRRSLSRPSDHPAPGSAVRGVSRSK